MKTEEKSEAIKHLEKKAQRHNEHLQKLYEVREAIDKIEMIKKGIGAFGNPYLKLEDIIEQIEPVLRSYGFITVFDDLSYLDTVPDGKILLEMQTIYVPTNTTITTRVLYRLDKDTPQGKNSAITYARRTLYCNLLAIPSKDDDGADAMTVGEIDNAIKSLRKRKEELENPKEHGTPVQTGSNNLAF